MVGDIQARAAPSSKSTPNEQHLDTLGSQGLLNVEDIDDLVEVRGTLIIYIMLHLV